MNDSKTPELPPYMDLRDPVGREQWESLEQRLEALREEMKDGD